MKRPLRVSSRPQAQRRPARRRAPGYLLAFSTRVEFDAGVLYTEGDRASDARTYPDALGDAGHGGDNGPTSSYDPCALLPR